MAATLEPLRFSGVNFNIRDQQKFHYALKLLAESLFDQGATLYCSDNLITWNKNYSFLRDPFFAQIVYDEKVGPVEKSILWRTYILLYFSEIASRADGDFLELGCLLGSTVAEVIQKIDFPKLRKEYYLYDLFEWNEGDGHKQMDAHKNPELYESVRAKFSQCPFVHVIKGRVPDSFEQGFPERVAFAHIDMNNPAPEVGALERVLPRLSKGGVVIFDDYGWWAYSAQKIALDPIIESHHLKVLELPTGQALLLKL